MHALVSMVTLVPALDGESGAASNSTATAVIALASMVSGYLLLFALWWFVFRDRSRRRRGGGDES